jgi:hypothetical protein
MTRASQILYFKKKHFQATGILPPPFLPFKNHKPLIFEWHSIFFFGNFTETR